MGAYHTIDLELNREVTIYKSEWDKIAIRRIEDACDVSKSADVAAIVCQEGLASLCLLTQHMNILVQKITLTIPRKRMGSTAQHDKALDRFFTQVYDAMLKHVDFTIVKALILASPGFTKVVINLQRINCISL